MKAVEKYFIVGVLPKEGLAGPQPANPPLGMTTTKTLRSVFSWRASNVFWFCTIISGGQQGQSNRHHNHSGLHYNRGWLSRASVVQGNHTARWAGHRWEPFSLRGTRWDKKRVESSRASEWAWVGEGEGEAAPIPSNLACLIMEISKHLYYVDLPMKFKHSYSTQFTLMCSTRLHLGRELWPLGWLGAPYKWKYTCKY